MPPTRVEKPCKNVSGSTRERSSGTSDMINFTPAVHSCRFASGRVGSGRAQRGQRGREIGGGLRAHEQRLAGPGMRDAENRRMKRLPAQRARHLAHAWVAWRSPVGAIAQHREAVIAKVHANLMGAASRKRR